MLDEVEFPRYGGRASGFTLFSPAGELIADRNVLAVANWGTGGALNACVRGRLSLVDLDEFEMIWSAEREELLGAPDPRLRFAWEESISDETNSFGTSMLVLQTEQGPRLMISDIEAPDLDGAIYAVDPTLARVRWFRNLSNGGRGLEHFWNEYCLGASFARIRRVGRGDLLLSSGQKWTGGGSGLTLVDALDGSCQMFLN